MSFITASYTGTKLTAPSRDISAVDTEDGSVSFVSTANTCSLLATDGTDHSSIDDNIACMDIAVRLIATADTSSILTAPCRYVATIDI